MRGFLILLVLSLAATEKLDRTYLPPPGAKFAGGTPDELQAPLTSETLLNENEESGFGNSRLDNSQGPTEFGSRTPTNAPFIYYKESVPTTTISYAFSQTTTLPPPESFGTTASPINPITGLPNKYLVPNYENYGNPSILGQERQNLERFREYQHIDAPILSKGQPLGQGQITGYVSPNYDQHDNQPLSQYQGQYQTANIPRGDIQVPSMSQEPYSQKYYNDKNAIQEVNSYTQSTKIPQNGSIYSQELFNLRQESPFNLNLESNLLPGSSQSSFLNLYNQNNNAQPSKSNKNLYNEDQYKQNNSFQQNGRNQDTKLVSSNPKDYQPESSLSFADFNQLDYSSTASLPQTSTIIPTFSKYKHREKSQAEADRNAVIVSYENIRSPNGYSYSYDTSNGIHGDESGLVSDGTKAQGSYSYIGDDGKIYSLTYTADENGFQPHGDHLPTPPPIPEAILKVIEQVTREEETGIYDDGYYHEEKYGDKKLQDKFDRVSSLNENRQYDSLSQNNQGKPITRIREDLLFNRQNPNTGQVEFDNKNKMNPNIVEPIQIPLIGNSVNEFNKIVSVDRNVVGTKPALIFDSKKTFQHVPNPKELQINYPESEVKYAEPNKYFESEIGLHNLQKQDVNNHNQLSNILPSSNTTPKANKEISEVFQRPNDIRYKENSDKQIDVPRTVLNAAQSNFNKFMANQPNSLVNDKYNQQRDEKNGYTYNQPQIKFEDNRFPTRFKVQATSTTMKPEKYKTYSKTSTLIPFMTPNVYNRDNSYRSPYSTIDDTSPTTESNYDDFSEDGQESKKQDLDIHNFSSARRFNDEVENTSRPYEIKKTTKLYQYMPNSQRNRVIQSELPAYEISEFSVVPTTPLPSQFGLSQATPDPIMQHHSTPTFGITVPSKKLTNSQIPPKSNFNSQTVGKLTNYNKTNLPRRPTFGYRPSTDRSSFPSYSTTTYKPISQYSASPKFAETTSDSYEVGYEYGSSIPHTSYGSNIPSRPALISSGPGMYSKVDPGTIYQSSYPYNLFEFGQSTGPINTKLNSQTDTSQLSQTPSYAQSGYSYKTTTSLPKVGTSTSQTYSTSTYRPNFDRNGQYTQKPEPTVNNNRRPINSADIFNSNYSLENDSQSTSYTKDNTEDVPRSNQDMKYKNISTLRDSTEQYAYSGDKKTGKVIGEDFIGPKQPQTFNSNTGYYY